MSKTRQPELLLQPKLIQSLKAQGWWAEKVSDRFKAGRPDLRTNHHLYGGFDYELKFVEDDFAKEAPTGLRLLQRIKMQEMNKHGMRAVGLIYSAPLRLFFVTLVLRDMLTPDRGCVMRGNSDDTTIDARELIRITKDYLLNV